MYLFRNIVNGMIVKIYLQQFSSLIFSNKRKSGKKKYKNLNILRTKRDERGF